MMSLYEMSIWLDQKEKMIKMSLYKIKCRSGCLSGCRSEIWAYKPITENYIKNVAQDVAQDVARKPTHPYT